MKPLTTIENGRHNNNPHDNGDVALSNNSWTEKQRHSRAQPPFDVRKPMKTMNNLKPNHD